MSQLSHLKHTSQLTTAIATRGALLWFSTSLIDIRNLPPLPSVHSRPQSLLASDQRRPCQDCHQGHLVGRPRPIRTNRQHNPADACGEHTVRCSANLMLQLS